MRSGDHNGAASDVSVIVVSYNSEPYLDRSLGAVASSGHELVVVDNASTDGSVALVRSRFPGARLVELDRNVGFGAACNEGMRRAAGSYFLLLNPDAWPVGEGVATLVRFAKGRPRLGAAGPRLRSPDGRPQQSAYGYPTALWLGSPAVTSHPRRRPREVPRRPYFLVGTALLLRRQAVEEVGGFDERFFMFNEEIDLCWRLHHAGWQVELCPDATFEHVGGASSGTTWPALYREQLRGHLLFVAKHRGLRQAERARRVLLASLRVRAAFRRDALGSAFREASAWLASGDAQRLIGEDGADHFLRP
jgi:N-acetylglucosaminyl-diphospho-decaprenol L-rhamnosyltransferase